MPRYRKKPVVVEAMQLNENNAVHVMEWVGRDALALKQTFDEGINIATKEGVMLARWGNYVIRGVKGEHYPCEAEVFHETYEAVEDDQEEQCPH